MRDLFSWNFILGRWAGVTVRLHVFFVLLAALVLFRSDWEEFWYGVALVSILLASVALHELGHCFAAWRTGGNAEEIVLWPFGGLMHVNVSQDPQQELSTSLAGPVVNLLICAVTMPVLVAMLDDWPQVAQLLNPAQPPWPDPLVGMNALLVMRLVFWVNWWLAMINLLPAIPFDGGRALRALLWPNFGYKTSVQMVVRAGKWTALLLVLVAWLVRTEYPFVPLPLLILATFLYFSAVQESQRLTEHEDEPTTTYDLEHYVDAGHHGGDQEDLSPFRRWIEARREARAQRQLEIEEAEEHRMDELLARLQEHGLGSLSPEDRALMDRVSARYRNRLRG